MVENKYLTRILLDAKLKTSYILLHLIRDGLLAFCFMIGLKVLNYFNGGGTGHDETDYGCRI